MPVGAAANIDLERTRGDTAPFRIRLRDKKKVAIDVTGYTALLSVDTRPEPTDESTQVAQYDGAAVSPGTDGTIEFAMLLADVDLVGSYYYDIQVTDGGGKVATVMRGAIVFKQDITK